MVLGPPFQGFSGIAAGIPGALPRADIEPPRWGWNDHRQCRLHDDAPLTNFVLDVPSSSEDIDRSSEPYGVGGSSAVDASPRTRSRHRAHT